MSKINVSFKFNIGDEVTCEATRKTGTVVKRKSVVTKENEESYFLRLSYSVQPRVTSHNTFRALEETTRLKNDYDDIKF